jgi:hypothetical protein
MSELTDFLEHLLSGRSVVFERRPHLSRRDQREAEPLLEDAYAAYALEVAGPPIAFQAHIALQAAALVCRACWLVVSTQDLPRYQDRLGFDRPPRSPSDHLSADLLLRFLPEVLRRARANVHANPLGERLCQVLRQWPLSGVLADIAEPPLTALDFGGHPGLMILYAERLVETAKPRWLPAGTALEYVEWIFQERGKPVPVASADGDDEELEDNHAEKGGGSE